jgi:hypothetical protein
LVWSGGGFSNNGHGSVGSQFKRPIRIFKQEIQLENSVDACRSDGFFLANLNQLKMLFR